MNEASQQQNSVLSCKNIIKTFHEGKLKTSVLHGIDLTVAAGEQIAIVGSSGSGKSTLLSILGGLALPTSGKVWLEGRDVTHLTDAERSSFRNHHIGFVYQFHHLLPEFSALENVSMPLLLRSETIIAAKNAAQEMLDQVGLNHRYHHKLSELSGGERQRVAIARALVTRPRCVLADEPTGNLDHQTAVKVYQLLLKLNRELNTSVIIVTHDLKLANHMDRILTLEDGRIIREQKGEQEVQ